MIFSSILIHGITATPLLPRLRKSRPAEPRPKIHARACCFRSDGVSSACHSVHAQIQARWRARTCESCNKSMESASGCAARPAFRHPGPFLRFGHRGTPCRACHVQAQTRRRRKNPPIRPNSSRSASCDAGPEAGICWGSVTPPPKPTATGSTITPLTTPSASNGPPSTMV